MALFDYSDIVNSSRAVTDIGKTLIRLTQASKRSQQRIVQLRSSTATPDVDALVQELNNVAQSILQSQNLLREIRSTNRNDTRVRPLTDLLLSLDNEKKTLIDTINKAITAREQGNTNLAADNSKTTFGQTALNNPADIARSPTTKTINNTKQSRAAIQIPEVANFKQQGFLRKSNASNQAGTTEGFERQALKIGRDTYSRDREYQQQQSRFAENSDKNVTQRLDTIIKLLGRLKGGGKGSGGFGLPDIDLDIGGKKRGNRFGRDRNGRLDRDNARGGNTKAGGSLLGTLLKGGVGAVIGNLAAGNTENTTGIGATIGGVAGSLVGPVAAAAGGYIGNDIEESLSEKGREAQAKRLEDKATAEVTSEKKSEDLGVAGRFERLKNLFTGQTSISDFFNDRDADAIIAKRNTAAGTLAPAVAPVKAPIVSTEEVSDPLNNMSAASPLSPGAPAINTPVPVATPVTPVVPKANTTQNGLLNTAPPESFVMQPAIPAKVVDPVVIPESDDPVTTGSINSRESNTKVLFASAVNTPSSASASATYPVVDTTPNAEEEMETEYENNNAQTQSVPATPLISKFEPDLVVRPGAVAPDVTSEDTNVTVQPRATVIINTDRLSIDNNGTLVNPSGTLGSADTSLNATGNFGNSNFGGIGGSSGGSSGGNGSGGIYSGSGAGSSAILGSRGIGGSNSGNSGNSGGAGSAGGAGGAGKAFTPQGMARKETTTSAFGDKMFSLPQEASGAGTTGGGVNNPYGFAGLGTGQLSAGGTGSASQLPTMGVTTSTLGSAPSGVAGLGANGRLAESRAKFVEELDNNPQLKDKAVKAMLAEGGPSRLQNNMEQLFNYADMRGMSIDKALHSGQFGPVNRGEVDAKTLSEKDRQLGYGAIDSVGKGSNNIEYRTDQGLLTDPGARKYMQDPEKYGYANIKGNNFFYHGEKGIKWAENQKKLDKEYAEKNPGATDNAAQTQNPQAAAGPANAVQQTLGQTPPVGTDSVKELQMSQAATRRLPIQDNLKQQLQFAAEKTGVSVEIGSGGQAAIGTGGPRTGSTRHDLGGAADLKLYQTDPTTGQKRLLNMNNPDDAQKMEAFTRESVRAGATGVGAGNGYMGPSTLHIGGGSKASWGGAEFIGRALEAGSNDRKSGQAEFEQWKAQKAAATAQAAAQPGPPPANAPTPGNTAAAGPVYDQSKVMGKPFANDTSVTMAESPEKSSMFAGATAPADIKQRSLGAHLSAYAAASKENALPNTAASGAKPEESYNREGGNARQFGLGSQGFMNQSLGEKGYSSVSPTGKGAFSVENSSTPMAMTPNAQSVSQAEGSQRQSAAPPVPEPAAPAQQQPAAAPANNTAPDASSNTNTGPSKPVGGGDAPNISQIPTKVEGLGLAAINMPDLA